MINRLKALREGRGWSALQLAAKSGVPVEAIKEMEKAESFECFGTLIRPIYAIKVARPFGIMVQDVFVKEE